MKLYFGHEKLPVPSISEVPINGGAPFDPGGTSVETELDIQQTGGMAPNAHVVLFNVPTLSDSDIASALVTIDELNATDVVNMSFSGPEIFYTAGDNGGQDFSGILRAEDELFAQGNAQGITFVGSSGDLGARPAPPEACFAKGATSKCGSFRVSAEFPASSPHVTSVGGTNLVTKHTAGSLDSTYVREAAFGDKLAQDIFYGTPATNGFWGSGGGNSFFFKKPAFQNFFNTGSTNRTVPDVSLQMGGCPNGAVTPCGADRSYTLAYFAGSLIGLVGTSISAPDFSGLTALRIQREGRRLGNVNYTLYAMAAAEAQGGPVVFHRNIQGYNGHYFAGGVYNRVLGVGTVYGYRYLQANVPVAGVPQTPSNP